MNQKALVPRKSPSPSPYRRYRSIEQAVVVLTLLGYKKRSKSTGEPIAREWYSETTKPTRVRLEISSSFPHRVIVRRGEK